MRATVRGKRIALAARRGIALCRPLPPKFGRADCVSASRLDMFASQDSLRSQRNLDLRRRLLLALQAPEQRVLPARVDLDIGTHVGAQTQLPVAFCAGSSENCEPDAGEIDATCAFHFLPG